MGNPFAHVELATDSVAGAKKFYKAVFDWKLEDIPGMGYTMIDVGKGVGGGITAKQMKEQPTAWLPYVEVADVKKSLAKAQKAGARVVVEYTEIGDMGSIAVIVDPQGAGIGLWATAPKKKAKPKPKAKAKKK